MLTPEQKKALEKEVAEFGTQNRRGQIAAQKLAADARNVRGLEKIERDKAAEVQKKEEAQSKFDKLASDVESVNPNVTEQDRILARQTIGAAGDIARRELEASLPILLAETEAEGASRGLIGSSASAANKAIARSQGIRSLENMLSRTQAEVGQALMQLPFMRANVELNKSQVLMGSFLKTVDQDIDRERIAESARQFDERDKGFDFFNAGAGLAGLVVGGPAGAAVALKITERD